MNGLADHEQKRYGNLQNTGQITWQDSTDRKEAKSIGASTGEYLGESATNVALRYLTAFD